jgi:hypothetical protein
MFYTPVSEKEAMDNRYSLLEPGHYPKAKVIEAEGGTSSKGNKFIKLTLSVMTHEGYSRKIFAYLSDTPSMRYLTRHLATALGLSNEYDNGSMTLDHLIRDVWIKGGVHIGVQKERSKEDGTGDMWPAKNTVTDFGLKTEEGRSQSSAVKPNPVEKVRDALNGRTAPPQDDFNDDIPF